MIVFLQIQISTNLNSDVYLNLINFCFSGQLRIPSHISILHVEQEVVGDDTKALQSVLECDTVRESLLAQEKQINSLIAAG